MSDQKIFPIIAIDGPSASGKGTIARRLAERLHFAYLDTGILYRSIALLMLRAKQSPNEIEEAITHAKNLTESTLLSLKEDPRLRSEETSQMTSKTAVIPELRQALLKFQRDFYKNPPSGKKGSVLDGRDIGTVVAPQAEAKIFVTADLEIRAKRRFKELQERGEHATYAAVFQDMKERDIRDQSRSSAPTLPAHNAVILDTSALTADQAFEEALRIVRDRLRDLS